VCGGIRLPSLLCRFVKHNFGAIAGILFGAAAFQFITTLMSCVVIRRGRAEQARKEAEEKHKAAQGQPGQPGAAYMPPPAAQVAHNPYNQPTVAQDHRF
jgi:hypothetical protein